MSVETIAQSNFFAALCNILAIFRPFCDIIADMQFITAQLFIFIHNCATL